MKKRIIAIVTLILLVATMLTGCKESGSDKDTRNGVRIDI